MSVATPALPVRAERLWAALAATLMNVPLGSVYAFSVLLRPIESADRTSHRRQMQDRVSWRNPCAFAG